MIDLSRKLSQVCVYWEPDETDEYGKMAFEDPVELPCRWSDANELYVSADGQEKTSSGIIYTAEDVETTGWLWIGELEDLPSDSDDPRTVEHAFEIKKFVKIPALHNDVVLRKAFL